MKLSRFFSLLLASLLVSCSTAVKTISNSPAIANSARITLGEDFGNKFFYEPSTDYPRTPLTYRLPYENVYFPSSNNTTLHGWFIPAKGGVSESRHTVVYSHGNNGTVGYHVNRVYWLANAGVNVFMYDYRGYGKSTGKITRKGLIDDASSAFLYAVRRPDIKHTKLISYGHSLGGAKSVAALATRTPPSRLVLAINESSFASYKDMAIHKAGVVGHKLVTETFSPEQLIDDLSIPVVVIHGTSDTLTPILQGRKLRQAASGNSLKYYWEVPGGSHYNCLRLHNNQLQKELLTVFKTL